jgi:hypothetical protein
MLAMLYMSPCHLRYLCHYAIYAVYVAMPPMLRMPACIQLSPSRGQRKVASVAHFDVVAAFAGKVLAS